MSRAGEDAAPGSPAPRPDPGGDKLAAVEEAELRIRVWGLGLGTTGAVGSALYWVTALQAGYLFVPLSWWLFFLIGLVAVFFFPPTRGPRVAREVLRRWDDLQVDAALEAAGAPTGPAQRVAADMAARILDHPRAGAAVKDVTRRLLEAIRRTGRDRRTVELVHQARSAGVLAGAGERSWSDLLDFVSAREGELLSSLERLHRAVVMREVGEVADLRVDAENLLARAEAEVEVELERMRAGEGEG